MALSMSGTTVTQPILWPIGVQDGQRVYRTVDRGYQGRKTFDIGEEEKSS